MRVIVQMRHSDPLHRASLTGAARSGGAHPAGPLAGLHLDLSYPAIQIPGVTNVAPRDRLLLAEALTVSSAPHDSTYVVRGDLATGDDPAAAVRRIAVSNPNVVGVFSDPTTETCLTCVTDPALGTAADVARLLGVADLTAAGMDGLGVAVAIVDGGVNRAWIVAKGHANPLDVARSFRPDGVPSLPGAHAVGHGTMCAFDVGIAAPRAVLLDHAVLLSQVVGGSQISGVLSDAIRSYALLRGFLARMPVASRALVVSNSWGLYTPRSDFPVGSPANYSDNPSHPFNLIVAALEADGADIVFSAGNCGTECPDGRCGFPSKPIAGANSHPGVLSVAGIDTAMKRAGFSSQGPGRLAVKKPDVTTYAHFTGSGALGGYPDTGTSASCPVAAGVIAAVRSKIPATTLPPKDLRDHVRKSAQSLGGAGWNADHGYGALDAKALLLRLVGVP